MARSTSPFSNHELPRSKYDFADSAREVCATVSSNNINANITIIAFFIKPPSTTKATISAITRHPAEIFPQFCPHNGRASEGCYNPRRLSFFSLRKQWPMTTPSAQEVTRLLVAWRNGDQEALERLTPLVYGELHRLAHASCGAKAPITLCKLRPWSTRLFSG
jgi:hypothetical protein